MFGFTNVINTRSQLNIHSPLNRGLFFCTRYLPNGPRSIKSFRNLVYNKESPTVYGTALTKCRAGFLNNGLRNTGNAASYLYYLPTINRYTTRLTGTAIYTPEALGGDYRIIAENNGGGTYPFLLRTSTSSKLEIYSVYGPAGLQGNTTLTVGKTYQLGFTIGASGTLLYVNGVLDAVGLYNGASMSNGVGLTVGGDLGIGGAYGIIEEVRLYNRELSGSEMKQLFCAARNGYIRETNWIDKRLLVNFNNPVLPQYSCFLEENFTS